MALDSLATVAKTLVSQFGKTLTLNRISSFVYDVSSGRANATETQETFKGAVSEYNGREINNSGIQIGDKKILAAAQGFTEPAIGDEVTIDGETFAILSVQKGYASSTVATYTIQARKA